MDDLFLPDFGADSKVQQTQETTWDEGMLSGLNAEQKTAVCHDEGPLLILAGAGSGKTRVITFRIAYLVRVRRVRPSAILAITFTNKAANEMKERIKSLIGDTAAYMWVGTFHSMFARILRRHADVIGYDRNFSILDTDDQQKIVKDAILARNLNEKMYIPRNILAEISKAKNELISPEEFERTAGHDARRQVVAKIYRDYQTRLKEGNLMDFDDILYYAVRLLSDNPDILAHYQDQFRYIMVDEYQDTNHAQYTLILLLSRKYRNLCVVGDDDQSIYSFRGANIRNILDFEKDFRDTKIIKLEQNYRSTDNILQAANSLIRRNKSRKSKSLRTDLGPGEKITWYCADHHGAEAYFVADQIHRLVSSKKATFGDIAVLYRMNALSRTMEGALREQGIPYRIYGGLRFYDRKEIKDVLAYLRLILSPSDNYAFDRIINVPKRGIGDTSLEAVHAVAEDRGVSYLQICARAPEFPELSRVSHKLQQFAWLLESFRVKLRENTLSFAEFIEYVQDQSGLMDEIIEQREKKDETVDRVENLKELLSEAVEFEGRRKEIATGSAAVESELGEGMISDAFSALDTAYSTDLTGILGAYLENAALYSDGDEETNPEGFVRLLTIHSAKGLEFGVVFLIGAEEGIFPGTRSMDNPESIEEERRLAYVAITRAKRKLFISTARSRILFGQTQQMPPSRFLNEVDAKYIEKIGVARMSSSDSSGEEMPVRSGWQERRPAATNDAGYGKRDSAPSSESPAQRSGFFVSGRNASAPSAVSTDRGAPSGGEYLGPDDVEKGMSVRHAKFGKGQVLKVEKIAGDALICVEFENKTSKNMLVRQAKLVRG